jgi:hypothetical protein
MCHHTDLFALCRSSTDLHHLTPLGFIDMAAFVTLCEAYMSISVPRSAASGDAATTPGSSRSAGLGVSGLL